MMKKFGVFYPIVFLMIIALFVIGAGGCGGSSHSPISNDTGSNETDGGDTVTPPRMLKKLLQQSLKQFLASYQEWTLMETVNQTF